MHLAPLLIPPPTAVSYPSGRGLFSSEPAYCYLPPPFAFSSPPPIPFSLSCSVWPRSSCRYSLPLPRAMLTQPQLILPAAEETHRTQGPTDVGRCKFSLNEESACIQLVTVERQSSGQKQLRSKRVSKPASAQLTARPTCAWQQGSAHAAVHQAAAPPGTPGPARALRGCCGRPPAARPGLPHGRPAATSGGWQGSSCRLWPGTPACAKRNTEWARRREAKHAVIADGRGRQAGKLG